MLVLERAPVTGGSAAISGGYVWTAPGLEGLCREDAGEFQRHGHLVVESYRDVTRWLSGFAEPVTDEQPTLHWLGHRFDIPLLIATMTRAVAAAGGDASDIYHRGYAGGLCAAAVTGRRAGTNAARFASPLAAAETVATA